MRNAFVSAAVWCASTLCVCPRVLAQQQSLEGIHHLHTAWTARDGLTGGVRAIAQTPDGYLWLGTETGLFRFDGVRFVPWTEPNAQTARLGRISALLGARDSTLWIATFDGLASWKHGALTRYPELGFGPVNALLEDHDGTIWAGGIAKLCSIRNGKIECRSDIGRTGRSVFFGNPGPAVYSLYEDDAHGLMVGAESGLWRWSTASLQRLLSEPVLPFQSLVRGDDSTRLTFIAGAPDGFVLRELVNDKSEDYSVPGIAWRSFRPTRLLREKSGALWVGSVDHGVVRVSHGKGTGFTLRDGVSSNFILALFEDREGTVWVGTTNGLDRFRESGVVTISGRQGLSAPSWTILASRDSSVWIGTTEGLNRLYRGRITIYRHDPSPGPHVRERLDPAVRERTDPGLADNQIGSLVEDRRGRIWVASRDGIASLENGRFTRVKGVTTTAGSAMTAAADEGVWVGSSDRGLVHLSDGREIEAVPFPWHDDLARFVSISAMSADPVKGGVWVGLRRRGLAWFKDSRLGALLTEKDGLASDAIWSLSFDHEGTLWAATQGGLSRIKDGRVATLTTRSGLPCDEVRSVVEHDASSLWLYTVCGIVKVARTDLDAWASDPGHTVHATVLNATDGVETRAIATGNTPVLSKAPDGKIWFVHGDGVSAIDPRHLPRNAVPPPVQIERLVANGRTYDVANGVRLPPHIDNLAIDYTAPSLAMPERVRFRFKLEGQDADWREVVNQRHVEYSNLPPGSYRFRMTASNNSGMSTDEDTSLAFTIAPAFYQTYWFRALGAAAFAVLLWALYQLRLRQIRLEEARFREAIETMPAIAFTTLPDGSPTFVNRRWEEYTGRTLAQALRHGLQLARHPEDVGRVQDCWRVALSTGQPLEYEVRLRGADGLYRWFLTRVAPLKDKRGQVTRWYGLATDIEDRKRAEHERERLRELEADLAHVNRVTTMGELTASLAHEIRQPLAATTINANACLRWLAHDRPNLDEAREAAQRIVGDSARAGEIIGRLRSLYTKAPPQREEVNVSEIVRELLVLLQPEATRYAVTIRTRLAGDLPRVIADRVQLQQVFMNLMLNGIEAMKGTGGGDLMVTSAMDQQGNLWCSVADSGAGLPADKTDEIFAPFFTTKLQGSGMGLSISRTIVESHDGRLWATPNEVHGATFHFTLPVGGAKDASVGVADATHLDAARPAVAG
jgi:PAS domain S-box-containing protein